MRWPHRQQSDEDKGERDGDTSMVSAAIGPLYTNDKASVMGRHSVEAKDSTESIGSRTMPTMWSTVVGPFAVVQS